MNASTAFHSQARAHLKMRRRDFLKIAAGASLVLPLKSLFIPKAPYIGKAMALPLGSGVTAGNDAMMQFLSTLQMDQWGAVPDSQAGTGTGQTPYLYSEDTSAADYSATTVNNNTGTGGPAGQWKQWSGGAHDTILNRGLIGPGGGHSGYCGNEIYAFDFASLTPYRVCTPDDFITQAGTSANCRGGAIGNLANNQFPNGDLQPVHSYSGTLFLDDKGTKGSLFINSDGYGSTAGAVNVAAIRDLSILAPYHTLPTVLGSGFKILPNMVGSTPAIWCYDKTIGSLGSIFWDSVFYTVPRVLQRYDFAKNTVSTVTQGYNGPGEGHAGGLREGHHQIYSVGGSYGNHYKWNAQLTDLNTGVQQTWTMTNTPPYYPGIVYCKTIDKILLWYGGNTSIIVLDPATQADTRHATTAAPGTKLPTSCQNFPGLGVANPGTMTKMWCDYVHHCIVMWPDPGYPVFVNRTTLF